MTDSDTSALREPLLALGGDQHETEDRYCQEEEFRDEGGGGDDNGDGGDDLDMRSSTSSYQGFPYPPEMVEAAEKAGWQSFGIWAADLAVKSLWSPSILPIFVALAWENEHSYVGIVQGTIGISQTLSSEVANWSTRHYNSQKLLIKLASVSGICAMGISFASTIVPRWTIWESSSSFGWFLCANGFWGLSWGLLGTALPMVSVESFSLVPRKTKETARSFHSKLPLASAIGTLFAISILFLIGGPWTVFNCVVVMFFGVAGNLIVVVALWLLKPISFAADDDDDGEEEDYYSANDADVPDSSSSEEEWFEPLLSQDELSDSNAEGQQDTLVVVDEVADDESETSNISDNVSFCCPDNLLIPISIHLADLLSSVAGGLSAWYFPLFLVQLVDVGPISLQFLYLIIPAGQKLSFSLANTLSGVIGPCLTCILFQWAYVLLLLLMLACESRGYQAWKVCTLYFLHGSLMNSTSSLSKEMIRIHVPVEEQNKWDLAETLQKLLWSYSGFVGGWLAASRWGILANLYSTATLQFVACFPLVLLYCLRNPPLENETKCDGDDLSSQDEDGGDEEERGGNTSVGNGQEYFQGTKTDASNCSPCELSTPSTPQTEPAESDCDDDSNDEYYYDALTTTWAV